MCCIKRISRIREIDFLKGIAIVMVVIGHTNCPKELAHIISLVHMPLFFMTSGFLSFRKTENEDYRDLFSFLSRKIRSLYLPFVCCSISVYSLYYLLGWLDSDIESYIRQILKFFAFGLGISVPFSIQHLWFLKTLFIVCIAYFLLDSGLKNKHWQLYALIVCLPSLFILLPAPFFVNILWPTRAFFYFLLGYYIRQINLKIAYYHLACLVFGWVILGVYWKDAHVDMRFSTGLVSCSMVLGTAMAFLSLFKVAKLISQSTFFDFFCFCGHKSLYIYLLHLPLFFIFSKLFFEINIDSCVVDDIHWCVYVLLVFVLVILPYCFYRRTVT